MEGMHMGVLFVTSYGHSRYVKSLCVKCFISCTSSVFLSVTCLVAAISLTDHCRIVELSMFRVVYMV